MSISKTQIKTSLPYCLYRVDNRFFKTGDKFNTKIRFVKVETTPNRRTQSSQNIETIRDRWGIDAHSDVEIYTDKIFDNKDVDKAEKFTLKLANDFIKTYRYFSPEAVHLIPLTSEDLFGLTILSNGKGIANFTFAGGITVANPLLNHEVSNKIEQAIANKMKIQLWEELMLNANQYLYQTEYRHSVLESIIALELVVSDFIRKVCRKKNISSKAIESYIRDVGLTGNIDTTLRILLSGNQIPDAITLRKCKTSIKIRNAIVHKGKKDVNEKEARDSLEYSKKLIQFLTTLLI
ncbi:hypothetical protein A3B50_04170 [Candidatus Roizmanbacteria bacterium RIFCSPLOWO2_01_FULL_40_42]|uniref:Apea-like HEPN domain-containing protein n=1 Tax=Candidatus Roizmanbacteria bacterium RIFCSPLOWO2_01_FULL_40_42 TaxID=1802066 RepID=A0A1F7J1Y8_9BACT|nr:MAG: hypothetical protein A3C31_04195 [Candidatus Roizmanbacteria bacterium RIFCSPHIGHO2_02_FULL_40_53]OGK29731.1 MAG: hypothetical protein A2W49_04705 [Candidatus Roizmanbacteria bacterium RIFCSPHIGHO2_12_41_18]OGK49620.1 MAG: hypothetical protein A3B50_04170 [Candidatus Roizmanbacteria bacterium RIFCSPLOWO2_01_FULL_40_42]